MTITITCTDPKVGKAVLSTVAAIAAAGNTETMSVDVDYRTHRDVAPRVRYVATNVANAPAALAALGSTTVSGIVYQAVVDATIKGEDATERGIREAHGILPKSAQRALVDLRKAGHVVSEPIKRA